eukprot:g29191.t1
MTNWLHEIRGKTGLCYLSSPADGKFIPGNLNLLLKTQASLDPEQLNFYTQQLQTLTKTATSATAGPRPTALVFDFFNEGHINAVRFDEDDAQRVTGTAPGSRATVTRRRQRRAAEAAEPTYQERKMKTWILLDGHHKVGRLRATHGPRRFRRDIEDEGGHAADPTWPFLKDDMEEHVPDGQGDDEVVAG